MDSLNLSFVGGERLVKVYACTADPYLVFHVDLPCFVQEAQRAGHQEAAAFLQQQIAQQLQQRQQQEQEAARAVGTG
jgi:hypothetical protein